jgi:hypothetical protein
MEVPVADGGRGDVKSEKDGGVAHKLRGREVNERR